MLGLEAPDWVLLYVTVLILQQRLCAHERMNTGTLLMFARSTITSGSHSRASWYCEHIVVIKDGGTHAMLLPYELA